MKNQIIIYAILIVIFLAFNFIKPIKDARTNDLINIVFASFLFLYIAYIAFVILKKMGNKK
nr:hypothetical protein [Soonwooa sp.]